MARMSPDEARREFDRLRERFEREMREKMGTDNPSDHAGHLPLHRGGDGEAQTPADMKEDDGFWETEIRRG